MCQIDNKLLSILMKEKGIEVKKLAEWAEVDRKTVYNILNGDHRPGYDVLVRIVFALNLTHDEIFQMMFAPNSQLQEKIRQNVKDHPA